MIPAPMQLSTPNMWVRVYFEDPYSIATIDIIATQQRAEN